jgi:hypothetical protein
MTTESEFRKLSKDMMRSLGETLHRYEDTPEETFQKDMQAFMFGRFLVLNALVQEANQDDAFTLHDVAHYLGSSLASIVYEIYNLGKSKEEVPEDITLADLHGDMQSAFVEGYSAKVSLLNNEPMNTTDSLQ